MKRSFMLVLSILFVVALLKDKTEGRESPYYLRNVDINGSVESEDHPWGGDGTGTHSVKDGGRTVTSSAQTSGWRFDIWISRLALQLFIPSKTPTTTPVSQPQERSVKSNGGTN